MALLISTMTARKRNQDMSHRIAQFESTLHQAVSILLQRDLSDPRIRGMVSVTEVKVSKEMDHATIKISVIPAEYEKLTLHGLNSAKNHIQNKLFKRLHVRRLPNLTFELDQTLKRQAEIDAAIKEGLAKEKEPDPQANSQEDTQESTS